MAQSTFINLHPNEYSQSLHCYPFAVNLGRCVGSYDTLNDLSNRVCVPNETKDSKLNVYGIITGKNGSKILTKHVSCNCKCKFDGRKCNSNQKWNHESENP